MALAAELDYIIPVVGVNTSVSSDYNFGRVHDLQCEYYDSDINHISVWRNPCRGGNNECDEESNFLFPWQAKVPEACDLIFIELEKHSGNSVSKFMPNYTEHVISSSSHSHTQRSSSYQACEIGSGSTFMGWYHKINKKGNDTSDTKMCGISLSRHSKLRICVQRGGRSGSNLQNTQFHDELSSMRSLYSTLQSSPQVRQGSCCFKHFLLNMYPNASIVVDSSQCNNYDEGTVEHEKEEIYVAYPELKVIENETRARSSIMRGESGGSTSNENAIRLPTRPAPGSYSTVDPTYQSLHPIIRDVTPLLHARDFSIIVQRVCPVDEHLPAKVKIEINFVAGLSYFKMANYKEAKCYLNASIELCISMGSRFEGDISICSVYLGDTEFNTQHYLEATFYYKKATQLYSTINVAITFRMVPPSLSSIHAKCGSALRNASKLVDGVQEYKMAIDTALTDKDRLAANTSLGNLYQSLGENNSALTHYQQSITLSEKLDDFVSLGWAHGNMGNAYLGLFQKDKALHHLQKSLELTVEYEPTPQAIGRTYNNLGTAYQSMGELDKAQEHYDSALSQAIYGNDVPGQSRVYGNIGNVLMLRKKYEEAIPHYGEVLRLSRDRSTLSTAHHNRGCAYYEWAETKKEALNEAESQVTSIKFYVHGPGPWDQDKHPHHLKLVVGEAADFYGKGSYDLQEVVKYHEESLENIKGSSKGLTLSVSLFETNSRTFHRLQDCLVNLGEYTQALLVAEQSRARTLGELMLKRKGWSLPHPISSPLGFDQMVSTISARTHPVFYLTYTGARLLGWVFVPTEDGIKMNMFEVPLRDDQFNGKSFDYHLRYSLTEALVERSFEMYRGVETYDEDFSEPVENLYNLIAKPLLCILRLHTNIADISKIVVISDSYTALVPYSCLRKNKKNKSPGSPDSSEDENTDFLGDKISFQLMPSLLTMSVLDQLPDANVVRLPAETLSMCIVGNPTVPQFTHNNEIWNLGKLPHAKREAEWVAHILKTTPILEEQATKSAVLMRIMSAKVIHLATHGSASAGFLAFGAMISIGNNIVLKSESVLLYPSDIEQLNINPALVVLSSCDSGRGTVKADGIQGMARAFILAGAQAVLTTLWRVPDESAAIFMQFFYQYMVDGMESTLALRKASLSIRCFSKYSQYIHWSGYQLTGRDVCFESSTPSSTQNLNQRLGPGTVFPRLMLVKELENVLVKNPCFPTDVQILAGCPGVKPAEVVIDFIHKCHQQFQAGIYWINCRCQEFISATLNYIQEMLKIALSQLSVSEASHALFVFDGLTSLPEGSQPLLELMKSRYTHIVVLYKHYETPEKLTRSIDHTLLRGTSIHKIDPLSMIHSTQRTVYAIQKETDLAPDNEEQIILEKLSEFTSGSPVLVDITSQAILSCLKSKALTKFATEIKLNLTRTDWVNPPCQMREISSEMIQKVPSVSTLTTEQRDVWDTKTIYDSWDSIGQLLEASNLENEEEVLLYCLSIFGCCPFPVSLTTLLSTLICHTSANPHLATSLLTSLIQKSYVRTYPLPVVMHPTLSDASQPEFVYVPQYIANYLWKEMDNCDKAIALVTSYQALSSLPEQPAHLSPFLLGIVSLLIDAYELNIGLMGKECYEAVYRLYITLLERPKK